MAPNPHIWQNLSTAVATLKVATSSQAHPAAREGREFIKAYLQLCGAVPDASAHKGRTTQQESPELFLA